MSEIIGIEEAAVASASASARCVFEIRGRSLLEGSDSISVLFVATN
jgi:hypothetical protein